MVSFTTYTDRLDRTFIVKCVIIQAECSMLTLDASRSKQVSSRIIIPQHIAQSYSFLLNVMDSMICCG